MSTSGKAGKTPEQQPRTSPVSRRLFLKGSGAAIASAGAATTAANAQEATPEATPMAGDQASMISALVFFNAAEAEMVEAITARILPGTPDDPGAREAGVVNYIDRALSGTNEGFTRKTYTQGPYLNVTEDQATVESTSRTNIYHVVSVPEDRASRYGYQSVLAPQDLYRRGLESLSAYSQEKFGTDFVELSEGQQDEILEDLDADTATVFEAPSGRAFFTMLRNHTIEGVFSDPIYGGNRDLVGWKLIGYPGARGYYTAEEMKDANFSAEPMSLGSMTNGHEH